VLGEWLNHNEDGPGQKALNSGYIQADTAFAACCAHMSTWEQLRTACTPRCLGQPDQLGLRVWGLAIVLAAPTPFMTGRCSSHTSIVAALNLGPVASSRSLHPMVYVALHRRNSHLHGDKSEGSQIHSSR
jgi:hypothetical protein